MYSFTKIPNSQGFCDIRRNSLTPPDNTFHCEVFTGCRNYHSNVEFMTHASIAHAQLVNTVFPLLINFMMEGSLDVDSFDKSLLLTLILDKFHDGRFTLK